MNHKQKISDPWLNRDSANRVPTLFSRFVHTVQADQAALILKDQYRQLE